MDCTDDQVLAASAAAARARDMIDKAAKKKSKRGSRRSKPHTGGLPHESRSVHTRSKANLSLTSMTNLEDKENNCRPNNGAVAKMSVDANPFSPSIPRVGVDALAPTKPHDQPYAEYITTNKNASAMAMGALRKTGFKKIASRIAARRNSRATDSRSQGVGKVRAKGKAAANFILRRKSGSYSGPWLSGRHDENCVVDSISQPPQEEHGCDAMKDVAAQPQKNRPNTEEDLEQELGEVDSWMRGLGFQAEHATATATVDGGAGNLFDIFMDDRSIIINGKPIKIDPQTNVLSGCAQACSTIAESERAAEEEAFVFPCEYRNRTPSLVAPAMFTPQPPPFTDLMFITSPVLEASRYETTCV